MTVEPTDPHDRFARLLLSDPERMAEFWADYLPAHLGRGIRLKNLARVEDTWVDPELARSLSDVVYRGELVDLTLRDDAELGGGPELRSGMRLLSGVYRDDFGERMVAAVKELSATGRLRLEWLKSLLVYAGAARELTEAAFREAVRSAYPDEKSWEELMPVFAQPWIDRGRTEGMEAGFEKGIEEARLRLIPLVLRGLRRLAGENASDELEQRIADLSYDDLRDLGEAAWDFQSPSDVERWFEQRAE